MKILIKIFKELFLFIHDIFKRHYLIGELARRDFKESYADSVLGLTWAILEPLSMALIMWWAFTFGLRVGRGTFGMPFVCYLFIGNLAWEYFSRAFYGSANVIQQYSFLVKKIDFRLSILPVVKMVSSFYITAIFFLVVVLLLFIHGIKPTWYWFQLLYYFFAMVMLVLGLGWLASAITVFVKDFSHIISILLQFGFWASPVLWNPEMLPESFQRFVKFNPMAYIILGYRNSLVYGKPFWQEDLFTTVYFWVLTFFFLLVGIAVFKRLSPHFADVI